jgi:hypothetical protein
MDDPYSWEPMRNRRRELCPHEDCLLDVGHVGPHWDMAAQRKWECDKTNPCADCQHEERAELEAAGFCEAAQAIIMKLRRDLAAREDLTAQEKQELIYAAISEHQDLDSHDTSTVPSPTM